MGESKISKEIFPGVLAPPFHYVCFTRFEGYSEDRRFLSHDCFQVILGLEGALRFELEGEGRGLEHRAGEVFVLSPGVRHRWSSAAGCVCENFMFFCDGFSEPGSELGDFFNPARTGVVWHFALPPESYAFYVGSFRELVTGGAVCGADIMHGLLRAFCGMVCRAAVESGQTPGRHGHPALAKALDILARDYRKPPALGVLAKRCGLGPSRLSELFRLQLGMTPARHVAELRAKKACQLLAHSDMNVTEVAAYLGFGSVHQFSRFFKRRTRLAPSAFASLGAAPP